MVLVGTSCFNEVNLAKIVISGSQFLTKFDQILVFTFLFCGIVAR